jgi:hypothetical protein
MHYSCGVGLVVQKSKQAELVWPSDPDILVQVDLVRNYW